MKYNELAVSVQLFNGKEQDNAKKLSLINSLELAVNLLMKGRNDRFEQGLNACPTRGNGTKVKALIEHVQGVAASHRATQKENKLLDSNGNVAVAPYIDYAGLVTECFALTVEQIEKKVISSEKRKADKEKKDAEVSELIEKATQADKLAEKLQSLESEKDTIQALQAENASLQAQNAFLQDLIEQVKAAKSLKEVKALIAE
jgi:murein L,D-transpeptidase YcbB/YkuD